LQLIIWHTCLWHGVYVDSIDRLPLQRDNLAHERRYLALKYSAKPRRAEEFAALHKYMQLTPEMPSLFKSEEAVGPGLVPFLGLRLPSCCLSSTSRCLCISLTSHLLSHCLSSASHCLSHCLSPC